MATAFLLNGRCGEAAALARTAADYAVEAADEAHYYRALGLIAASQAVSGEFIAAFDALSSAAELAARKGWARESWPTVFAAVLIHHRQGDVEAIRVALKSLDKHGVDVVERLVAKICLIWLRAAGEDYRGMVVAATGVTHGIDRRLAPPLLLDLAKSLECLALIQLGDPVAALRTIEGCVAPSGHSVCFDLLRATCYLALAQPRKALQATDECILNCPDHNLRTLPSVHLRRAVAFDLLGLEALADAEFSRSAHLGAELGSVSPAVGLPLDVLDRVFRRLLRNELEFGKVIAERIPASGTYPDPVPLGFVPVHLTERERVVAQWLSSDLTRAEIGAQLHVSVNTLKSQLSSLYRKLDVATREDAVRSLVMRGVVSPPSSGPAR